MSILRLDLTTHRSMGNKHFKLMENLQHFKVTGVRRVLSFGGAWSNHLLALAQSAQALAIETVGVVRGDEGFDNDMLARMRAHNMQLHFVSRADYKLRHTPEYYESLCRQLNCDCWLPEGGSNQLAVKGCEELAQLINDQSDRFTRVVAAVGTGATIAGIIRGCNRQQFVTGIPVVNDPTVVSRIHHWISLRDTAHGDPAQQVPKPALQTRGESVKRWALYRTSQPTPYGKPSRELLEFILDFYQTNGVALDPVYTGPALATLLSAEFLEAVDVSERVIFVHTGGLAGAAGFIGQFARCTDQTLVKQYFDEVARLTD